jgi:circadian clock protein KaiB
MKSREDPLAEFEQTLLKEGPQVYTFRLYVSGASPKSVEAIRNIKKICEEHLPGHYDLEVIDIYQQPDLATREQVVAAPMLIKESPGPLRRLIGNLSSIETVLRKLGLSN